MGFEEIADQFKYRHQLRDYSKRKNKFKIEEFPENISSNRSFSPRNRRSNSRKSDSSVNSRPRRVSAF